MLKGASMKPARAAVLAGIAGLMFTAWGCGPELLLGAGQLEISPNPAQPGDSVSFVFRLRVVPEQDYTVIAFIDSTSHQTVDGFEAVDGPFVLQVGTADELIATYGLGAHTAYVEVRLLGHDRTAQTAAKAFELVEAAQPAPGGRDGP